MGATSLVYQPGQLQLSRAARGAFISSIQQPVGISWKSLLFMREMTIFYHYHEIAKSNQLIKTKGLIELMVLSSNPRLSGPMPRTSGKAAHTIAGACSRISQELNSKENEEGLRSHIPLRACKGLFSQIFHHLPTAPLWEPSLKGMNRWRVIPRGQQRGIQKSR